MCFPWSQYLESMKQKQDTINWKLKDNLAKRSGCSTQNILSAEG